MQSALTLVAVILSTLAGDYLIKVASQKPDGLTSATFLGGVFVYALSSIGWFYLMRGHSLAAIGVLYSSVTVILLAGLGVLVFKEAFGPRELAGITLAIAAVVVISR